MASEIQTPLTTENTEITERFQVGPSEAIHSDPRALDPLGQLADVDLILLGRVSLLRILLSVISVLLTLNFFEPCANSWAKTKYELLSIRSCKLFICQKLNAPNFRR